MLVSCSLVWFVPYHFQAMVPEWALPLSLLYSILVYFFGLLPDSERAKRFLKVTGMLTFLASCTLSGFELRKWYFDPIESASGTIYLFFERLIPTDLLAIDEHSGGGILGVGIYKENPQMPAMPVRCGEFSVENTTVGEFFGGPKGPVTQIVFRLSGNPKLDASKLQNISARTFCRDYDFLMFRILWLAPPGECFTGTAHLVLNQSDELKIAIPRQCARQSTDLKEFVPPIIIPLRPIQARSQVAR